jgi:hypothetical protein
MRLEEVQRGLDPALAQRAVPVDELHVGGGAERREPGVARPRRGERNRRIQRHDRRARRLGGRHAAVGRPRVDVDDPADPAAQRVEAGDEPRAFVAPDHHRRDLRGGNRRVSGGEPRRCVVHRP